MKLSFEKSDKKEIDLDFTISESETSIQEDNYKKTKKNTINIKQSKINLNQFKKFEEEKFKEENKKKQNCFIIKKIFTVIFFLLYITLFLLNSFKFFLEKKFKKKKKNTNSNKN